MVTSRDSTAKIFLCPRVVASGSLSIRRFIIPFSTLPMLTFQKISDFLRDAFVAAPAESKPKRRMSSTKTIGVRLIGKKSPGQRRQAELRSTDSRRQTRKRRSSLRLALLDLSSRYFLKHSNKDISRNVKFFRHALSAVGRSVRCQAVISQQSAPRDTLRSGKPVG